MSCYVTYSCRLVRCSLGWINGSMLLFVGWMVTSDMLVAYGISFLQVVKFSLVNLLGIVSLWNNAMKQSASFCLLNSVRFFLGKMEFANAALLLLLCCSWWNCNVVVHCCCSIFTRYAWLLICMHKCYRMMLMT